MERLGSAPSTSESPLEIYAVNNCCDELSVDFFQLAQSAAEERRQKGYDADGKLNGPFNERNPPPGMRFGGYLKGCMGILWTRDEEKGLESPGYCTFCGHSLYHYAGMKCHGQDGVSHPPWQGDAPPSFGETNK